MFKLWISCIKDLGITNLSQISCLYSSLKYQIGSRITGRRISQMIEKCSPSSYVLVDDHPGRHDPSHIMTHRIQSTVSQFSDCVIKCCNPDVSKRWKESIQGLDMMVCYN